MSSGACHLGGIDTWAEEIGREMGWMLSLQGQNSRSCKKRRLLDSMASKEERKESRMAHSVNKQAHYWSHCPTCKEQVIFCGTCGNNCCNGGYGEIDGKECPDCQSAYLNAMCICAQGITKCPKHGNQPAQREICPLCGAVCGHCPEGEYCTKEECKYVA